MIHINYKALRKDILIIVFFVLLITISCNLPWEPGPQPTYIESNEYKAKMNVLGIIRPGTNDNFSLSFVHLERIYDFYDVPDSLEIEDAQVQIFRYDSQTIVDTIQLEYTDAEGLFETPEYRTDELYTDAQILAGQSFGILCKRSGYPALSAQTTVPLIPEIVNDRVDRAPGLIEFDILRDERVKVYDVYLDVENKQVSKRFIRPESGNTHVSIEFTSTTAMECILTIYAYDLYLSEYITFNIIIKPQTYQSTYSTVDNGYGCFGSINILEKIIRL